MIDQPKPTGEWTAEYVRSIGGHFSIAQQRDQAIADAHNAALAAKNQEWHGHVSKLIDDHKNQLAAEREKSRDQCNRLIICGNTIDKLKQQLAAEREKLQRLHNALEQISKVEWSSVEVIKQFAREQL